MAIRTIFHHKSSIFQKLYKKETNSKQKKRYQALYLLSERYKVGSVSDIVGISRRMINKWVGLYNKEGINGLKIKRYKGAVKKIDSDIRREIVNLVQTPPRKIGFNFSSWNTKTIKIWLNEVYHIEITKPRIFQILKEEKFSWKKGEHRYILADEKEQIRFIRKARKIFQNLKPNQIAMFQDECSVRQHPSLTHMWMKTGTVIEIPTFGNHKKNEFLVQ
jgi:transposase